MVEGLRVDFFVESGNGLPQVFDVQIVGGGWNGGRLGFSSVVFDRFDRSDRFDFFDFFDFLFKAIDVFLLLSCESAFRFEQVFDPFEGGQGVGQVCSCDVNVLVDRHFLAF